MKQFRSWIGHIGLFFRLVTVSALLLVAYGANADSGDSLCLSLYPKSGALQGTPSCRLIAASNTPAGMGSYSCTNNLDLISQWCNAPPDGAPENNCPVADPIYPATGATIITEADFSSGDDVPLTFQRTYRAQPMTRNDAGPGSLWFHNWQMKLGLSNSESSTPQILVYRADGNRITFNKSSGIWRTAEFSGLSLTRNASGWMLTDLSTGTVEAYSQQGVLLSINTHNGRSITLAYSDATTPSTIAPAPGLLIAISQHALGYTAFNDIVIRLAYDKKWRLSQMTDPTGATTRYVYDSLNNLASVTWPDGSVRQYFYEDTHFGGALTGVVDETGKRIATWTYDAKGRATAVNHPDTTRNVQLSYGNGTTTVTDVTGSNTLNYSWLGDLLRTNTGSSPKGASSFTWDSSGNLLTQTNPAESTDYSYDDAGRPVRAVVRSTNGTVVTSIRYADATTLRPYMISYPGKVRAFAYDASGNATGISEVSTNDPTGENGFEAHKADGEQTAYGAVYDAGNNLSYLEIYRDGVLTATWDIIYDNSGNRRFVSSRWSISPQPLIFARDAAHRIVGVTVKDFVTSVTYDARGRVSNFRLDASAQPESGGVKRTLTVDYGYSLNGKVISRTGMLETNNGGALPISNDDIDRWLDNYENGVTPIVPTVGMAGVRIGIELQTDTGELCVECYVNAVSWPAIGPDPRAFYNFRTGRLTAGGPVDMLHISTLKSPPLYSSSQLNANFLSDSPMDSGTVKCHDDGCAAEKVACKVTCTDAAGDFRKPNIWYRKFNKCFAGCYPARCGGNPYRGFASS